MSNDFSLFGLKPVFEKGKRFLHTPEYIFKDQRGKALKYTLIDFLVFLIEKDEETYIKSGPPLFQPESVLNFTTTHLKDPRLTVNKLGEIDVEFFINNPEDPEREKIVSNLNHILNGVFIKYLIPLVKAEERLSFAFSKTIIKGTSNVVRLKLSLLEQLKAWLYVIVYGQPKIPPQTDEEKIIATETKASAEVYLRLLSFYITEVTAVPSPDDASYDVVFTVDLNNDQRVKKEEIDVVLFEYMKSKLFAHALDKIKPTAPNPKEDSRGLKPKELKTVGVFRKPGHLSSVQLKYTFPKITQRQIWDGLEDSTKNKIKDAGYEESIVTEGVNLPGSEMRMVNSLCKMLHERSQTSDPKKEDYYAGNRGLRVVTHGLETDYSPTLAFTLYELTKEFLGGALPSGKDIENVEEILTRLGSRKFLFSYQRKIPKDDGGYKKQKIERFSALFQEYRLSEADYTAGNTEIEGTRREQKVIVLHPIFRDQIDSNFIVYPNDFNRRLMIAFGDPNVSEQATTLVEWLVREHSFKRQPAKLDKDRLMEMLCHKLLKSGKRGRANERVKKAIETAKTIGIITDYKEQPAAGKPGLVSVFTMNTDWG